MTGEEKAEEYVQSIEGDDCVIITDREERKQAYLAGLKAGRPQWHDLRKDPNDLPKKNGEYWAYMSSYGNKIKRALVWENGVFDNMYDATILAWCEIPQFKE